MDSSDTEASFHEDDDNDTIIFSTTSRSDTSFSDGYECDTIRYNEDGSEYIDRIFVPYINSNERRRHHYYYNQSSKFKPLTPDQLERISVLTPLEKIVYSNKKQVVEPIIEKTDTNEEKTAFQWNMPSNSPSRCSIQDIMIQQKKEDEELQKQLLLQKRSEELIRDHEERKRHNRTSDHKRLLKAARPPSSSHQRLLGSSSSSNNNRFDILCKKGRSCSINNCKLAHSFEEWEPKCCQYGLKCSKKKECTFRHVERESTREYLQRCIDLRLKIFEKHYADYERLLLVKS